MNALSCCHITYSAFCQKNAIVVANICHFCHPPLFCGYGSKLGWEEYTPPMMKNLIQRRVSFSTPTAAGGLHHPDAKCCSHLDHGEFYMLVTHLVHLVQQ